jgi:hypothetical protein
MQRALASGHPVAALNLRCKYVTSTISATMEILNSHLGDKCKELPFSNLHKDNCEQYACTAYR